MRPALRRPLASSLGAPENVFSSLSATIRYPCSDRGMHGTSTLSQREGIRGYARTHTDTHRHRERQFCCCLFLPLFPSPSTSFLPPPLFEPQGVALIGPGGCPCVPRARRARGPGGSSPAAGAAPAKEFGHIPGWQHGSPLRSRSSLPPRSFPSFLRSFHRGVSLLPVSEVLAKLLSGCEERLLGDNFQGCRTEKDTFSFLHENETCLIYFFRAETLGLMSGLGAVISSLSERRISRHFRTPRLKLTNPQLFTIIHERNSPYLFQPVVFKPVEYQRLQKILPPSPPRRI